jgi:hypothetical protein
LSAVGRQDGGLTWGELTDLVGTALSNRDCLGWTLCIYNPDLDPDRTETRKIVDVVHLLDAAPCDYQRAPDLGGHRRAHGALVDSG